MKYKITFLYRPLHLCMTPPARRQKTVTVEADTEANATLLAYRNHDYVTVKRITALPE